MSKILKKIFDFVLIIIMVFLVGYFILRTFNIIKIYNVETGSMEDKIHTGDYIISYKKKKYYVGDVITYKVGDYFITHRIISINGDKIITKGDANNVEDDKISIDQIEGKAIYWGGFLNLVINYKYTLVAFLIGLYLLSCYLGVDERVKRAKGKSEFNTKDDEIPNDIKEEKITEVSISDEKEIKVDDKLEDTIKVENVQIVDAVKKKSTNVKTTKKTTTSKKKASVVDKSDANVKKVSGAKKTSTKGAVKKKTATVKTTTSKKKGNVVNKSDASVKKVSGVKNIKSSNNAKTKSPVKKKATSAKTSDVDMSKKGTSSKNKVKK